jgi:non-canonical purine NTP pyrophosphatase (RdgB/HAM1 family)
MFKPLIVYATSNPGKITEMKNHLGSLGITVTSLADLGCDELEIEENGTSLGENAALKAKAYAKALSSRADLSERAILVLSDDTGFEIAGLNNAPGLYVRRWKDHKTKMGDEEIIDYALDQMKGLSGAERAVQAKTVLAICIVYVDRTISEPVFFEGTLSGHILEEADALRVEGFPFASLMFVDEWNMVLGVGELLPPEEKVGYANHRARAINNAFPYLNMIQK